MRRTHLLSNTTTTTSILSTEGYPPILPSGPTEKLFKMIPPALRGDQDEGFLSHYPNKKPIDPLSRVFAEKIREFRQDHGLHPQQGDTGFKVCSLVDLKGLVFPQNDDLVARYGGIRPGSASKATPHYMTVGQESDYAECLQLFIAMYSKLNPLHCKQTPEELLKTEGPVLRAMIKEGRCVVAREAGTKAVVGLGGILDIVRPLEGKESLKPDDDVSGTTQMVDSLLRSVEVGFIDHFKMKQQQMVLVTKVVSDPRAKGVVGSIQSANSALAVSSGFRTVGGVIITGPAFLSAYPHGWKPFFFNDHQRFEWKKKSQGGKSIYPFSDVGPHTNPIVLPQQMIGGTTFSEEDCMRYSGSTQSSKL